MSTPPEAANVGAALDANLRTQVSAYTKDDRDYWSFRGNKARQHSHGYFQYPAMMVPEMISDLIRTIISVKPSTKAVFDPYAGSGTVLTEAMLQGRDFLARDINPLAILLCKVKRGPFFSEAMRERAAALRGRIKSDKKWRIEIDFTGRNKWFTRDAAIGLSKIRRAIQDEPAIWARRFFWIALAETVRTTSNSRTSTFKLHMRPEDELAAREVNPIDTFEEVLKGNLQSLDTLTEELLEQNHIYNGHYEGTVDVEHHDARKKRPNGTTVYDLLVTSPPYGDNVTTVPYGQHAFLPLQWIELSDIDEAITSEYLKTTHEIDARSLGEAVKTPSRIH
jgi:DNA methylase